MTETEAQLEAGLLERLVALGWSLVALPDEAAQLKNLKAELEAFNRVQLSDAEFARVLNHLDRSSVFERAKVLRDRYELTREDGTRVFLAFFNSREWRQNRFQVAQQVVQAGAYDNRYDVTLLVNGLPLVQIELKRRGLEIKEAFNQVNRYQRHSYGAGRGLFQYVQIFVISNGVNTRYYVNNRKQSFKQTFTWAREDNAPLNRLDEFSDVFLDQCHIAKMVARYIVLHEGDKQLLVLRPYQYYAVEAILASVRAGTRGGYIWHTTGSGKTLTSFKAAQLINEMEGIDKVLFVVDRADLDYQTTREFNAYSDGSVDGTHNTHNLVRQMTGGAKLIVTTIQKLNTAISRPQFLEQMGPMAGKRIVFIFDECHRSQFGDTHKRITNFFNNYQMFGFTGTPILKENANTSEAIGRTTKDLFGPCLHKYIITDAIRDQNVLRFGIEYWGRLRSRDGGLIDEKVAGIDTQEFYDNPDRIEAIVDWIITNHSRKTHARDFTAMMAVSSVESLIQYYECFRAKKSAGEHDLRVVTIFTYGTNEDDKDANGLIQEPEFEVGPDTPLNLHSRDALERYIGDYNALYGTAFSTKDSVGFYSYYKDIAKRIKERERENANPRDRVDILLVVAMFLTGFDAKKVNTLYVDKNLKYHGLIQAYSRTNRVLNEVKSQGNVVAFRNLKPATDEAIKLFADREAPDEVLIEPYDTYVARFNAAVETLLDVTPTVDSVDALRDDTARLTFVKAFRALARLKNILSVFAEFEWAGLAMDSQTFDDFKSKYLDLHDQTRKDREEGVVSIVGDVDFELELIREDKINVAYILQLLRDYKDDERKGGLVNDEDRKRRVTSILDMVSTDIVLRSKRELIEKFIDKNMPQVRRGDDVTPAFEQFWTEERAAAVDTICSQEGLDPDRFEHLMRSYVFSHNIMRDDVVKAMQTQPRILERRRVVDRVIERLTSLVRTFDEDVGVLDAAD